MVILKRREEEGEGEEGSKTLGHFLIRREGGDREGGEREGGVDLT